NISLNLTDVTVREAIEAVKKQAKISFFFNVNDVNLNQRVSVNAKEEPLEKVLNSILKGQNLNFEIKDNHIVISKQQSVNQSDQKTSIIGKVRDNAGEPLIGVNIVVKGMNGTISDIDGNYSINAPSNSTLVFSYIGYETQEVKIRNKKNINVVMCENQKMLDEVVVVGYGTQKKANLTGAIGYVSGEKLEDRPVANLGQALQGAIPNMNISFGSGKPGEATQLNIRGAGSINGNDSPLVLIDGVEGSLDNINPRDVESISVLKDASSAAIYGARAAFGVVLVTTKSAVNGKIKVTYNGRYSFSRQTTNSNFLTTGYDAAVMVDEFMRSYNGSKHTFYSSEDMEELKARRYDTTENPDRPWVVEKNGRYMYYANFDWYNYLIDSTRPTWEHNLSLSGGNEKLNYNVSGNYYTQKGIYRGDHPDRYKSGNIRSRIKSQVTPWMEFNLTTSLNARNYYAPGMSMGDNLPDCTFDAFPFLVPVNPDGTNVFSSQVIMGQPTGGVHTMIREGGSFTNDKQKTFLTTAGLVFKLYKGLTLNANYSFRYYTLDQVQRSNTSTFSQTPGKIEISENALMKNKLRQTSDIECLHVADAFLSYENVFFKHHNIRALLGLNYESFYRKRLYAFKLNIQSDILNDFNLGDNTNVGLGGEKNAGQSEYASLDA
ncbi:MAG: SusC/RagA family TonB-linked outer membrane protein, partial [Bacteroidaceae bacterium]